MSLFLYGEKQLMYKNRSKIPQRSEILLGTVFSSSKVFCYYKKT